MILLLITIVPQITNEDNIMTLLLITIMSQIINKEFISFYFLTFFKLMPLKNIVYVQQKYEHIRICLTYN